MTSEEAFRLEVRSWLAANLDRERFCVPAWTPEGLKARRAWELRLHDAGYGVLTWPREWGGVEASLELETTFQEECLRASAPERLNKVGLGMAAPTILNHGTDEQRQRWLPGIADCREIWCQGFSEPGAGSDLAAVLTKGELDGDDLVISGQKTWTTSATIADWMFALVRTSGSQDRRAGLTFVMVPLDLDGVEVRPIRQLHGAPGFADVFLDAVRVPMVNVIGRIGDGWRVAMETLRYERSSGLASHVTLTKEATRLANMVRQNRVEHLAGYRAAVADAFVSSSAFAAYVSSYRGQPDLGRASTTKLLWSQLRTGILEAQAECASAADSVDEAGIELAYWHARAAEIFGGSNEIQRNIIARTALALPRQDVAR